MARPLLLSPLCFYETEYTHFTTRVFGHSAISPFLGGCVSLFNNHVNMYKYVFMYTSRYEYVYMYKIKMCICIHT